VYVRRRWLPACKSVVFTRSPACGSRLCHGLEYHGLSAVKSALCEIIHGCWVLRLEEPCMSDHPALCGMRMHEALAAEGCLLPGRLQGPEGLHVWQRLDQEPQDFLANYTGSAQTMWQPSALLLRKAQVACARCNFGRVAALQAGTAFLTPSALLALIVALRIVQRLMHVVHWVLQAGEKLMRLVMLSHSYVAM